MTTLTAEPIRTAVGSAAARDADSVHRVITIVATDACSWAEATRTGVAELAKTITDLRVAQLVERDTVVRYGKVIAYRVKLQVSFRIDARRMISGQSTTVRRYLVVVNGETSLPLLTAALRERMAVGPCEFHLLAPLRVSTLAGSTLVVRPWTDRTVRDERRGRAAQDRARELAESRLTPVVEELRAAGAATTWETLRAEPCSAVVAVMARATFDEVLISSPSATLSRLARVDLPRRLRRRCGLPVSIIEDLDLS
jgi:flavin-binding protein dodecin